MSRSTAGSVNLTLSQNGTTQTNTTCTTGATSSCAMNFAGGVSFTVTVPHHKSGEQVTASVKAMAPDPNNGQCVAAFKNQTKTVQYSCQHITQNDTSALKVSTATLACATGVKQGIGSSFNLDGIAELPLSHQDVGKLKLMAELDDAKGDTTFTVAPFSFKFSGLPTATGRAGEKFDVTVTAVNKTGATTPSFDRTRFDAAATATTLTAACAAKGSKGQITGAALEFVKGSGTASLSWSEVGSLDIAAALGDFLGSKLEVAGTSAIDGKPCASVGPFIPKYFVVDYTVAEAAKARAFYYAGEPVPVIVSAMNAQGQVTQNYSGAYGLSQAVTLTAVHPADLTPNPGAGELEAPTVPASKFNSGVAEGWPEYWAKGKPMATTIRFRASNGAASDAARVTSFDNAAYEKARPAIKSGRLRIGNDFGKVGAQVTLPIEVNYWTGNSWLYNAKHPTTVIPKGAFARVAKGKGGTDAGPTIVPIASDITLTSGKGKITLSGDKPGWIDLALNLGNDTKVQACNDDYPASQGAALRYLRMPGGCLDPSGRATFGDQAAERKRLIHMREVFN